MTPLTLAARATVGLEPGVLVRVRSVRPAECIFAGIDAKKELAEEQSRKRLAELELERAQIQLREAQAKIARLKGQP